MSSAVAPPNGASSSPPESSSASSNVMSNSNQQNEKSGFSSSRIVNQLNDNYEGSPTANTLPSTSLSLLDHNKENKDANNMINNNKNYSHGFNSNNSSTTTIVGSNNSAVTIKGSTIGSITTTEETKRSCNRCQNCPGFSSHEWRNTCTSCRCPRSCHDISIGARCCGFHRAGFDPSSAASSTGQANPLQTTNSVSTIPVSVSSSVSPPSMQPPPPSGSAPSIENSNSASPPTTNTTKTNYGGATCSRTAVAEAEGYSWMPPVRSTLTVEFC